MEVCSLDQLAPHNVPIGQNSLRLALRIMLVQDHECTDMAVPHHPRRIGKRPIRICHDDVGSSDLADDHGGGSCIACDGYWYSKAEPAAIRIDTHCPGE